MPQLGGQPSADKGPAPTVHDDFPSALAVAKPDVPQRQGVVPVADDNVARVDRIIAERAQAQRLADDVRDLRGEEPVASAKPRAGKATSPPADPPAYDPASDAAEIAKLVTPPRSARVTPTADDALVANANVVEAESGDYGDQNLANDPLKSVVNATMATPTQIQALDPLDGVGPMITRQSASDPMLAIEQKYANRITQDPRDLTAQLEYQLLRFLKNEQSPKAADLSALPGEDQELLSAMCDALTNFRSVIRAQPNPLGSEKARPFIEMAERIASRSDLAVSSATLCQRVEAYGNYVPIEPLRFDAGRATPAIFYCEVDGFLPQLNEQQQWETKLSLELKLYSASKELQVWNVPAQTVVDVARKRRRDFFVAKMIELPPNLPPDRYLLKAAIKDLQANRMAESTLQFEVAKPVGR